MKVAINKVSLSWYAKRSERSDKIRHSVSLLNATHPCNTTLKSDSSGGGCRPQNSSQGPKATLSGNPDKETRTAASKLGAGQVSFPKSSKRIIKITIQTRHCSRLDPEILQIIKMNVFED